MSIGVSTAQLARMRAQVALMLPDTAIIKSETFTSDGLGSGTASWSAVASGTVACRVDPLTATQAQVGTQFGQETLTVGYQLTVPYDAPLAENYRVTIDSEDYEIVRLDIDHSWNVSKRAIIKAVR